MSSLLSQLPRAFRKLQPSHLPELLPGAAAIFLPLTLALPLAILCTLPAVGFAAEDTTTKAVQPEQTAQTGQKSQSDTTAPQKQAAQTGPAAADDDEGEAELVMDAPAEEEVQDDQARAGQPKDGQQKAQPNAARTRAAAATDTDSTAEGTVSQGADAGTAAQEKTAGGKTRPHQTATTGSADEGTEGAQSPYSAEAMALWPSVDSLVTSRFGERRGSAVPLLSDVPMRPRYHSGLDLRGHLGWPVRSLKDGTVVQAGRAGSAGLIVKIAQTDGKTVAYAHLGKVLVKKGDTVKQGQHVGEVGCTGRTTGAHVHLTVRDSKGRHIDPRKELTGLWELYDPPLEELKKPITAQACMRRGVNKRLAGTQQYLRMRKALIESGSYKIPEIEPWSKSH